MSKDPKKMTAAQINQELEKLDQEDSELIDRLIKAGRGKEKFKEVFEKDDPLSLEVRKNWVRQKLLWEEIEARLGYRSYRLPVR